MANQIKRIMKELSIEEKAKRYDEALKAAIVAHKDEDKHLKATLERIFPELKESEDERIRKWLIEVVEEVRKANPTNAEHNGMCSEAIAWLEKQGEQKSIDDLTQQEAMDIAVAKCFEQGEQNHAWSEEDESMRTRCIGILGKCYMGELPTKVEEELNWLKNLEDRVQPQPKQEWSEEDKAILEKCIGAVKVSCYSQSFKSEAENWLKSLRPQNRWKPSDEQMKCLDNVKGSDDHNGYILNTLYNDLKKLREE